MWHFLIGIELKDFLTFSPSKGYQSKNLQFNSFFLQLSLSGSLKTQEHHSHRFAKASKVPYCFTQELQNFTIFFQIYFIRTP